MLFINTNIVAEDIEDGGVLFDSKKKKIHILNNTAYEIWKLINNRDLSEIVCIMEEKYPDCQVSGSVQKLILDLIEKECITSN